MEQENIDYQEVPNIIDYNNDQEIMTEYDHQDLQDIQMDDQLIENLNKLNLENLLNIEPKGENDNLKNNFQALINAFQVQQNQMKQLHKFLNQDQEKTNNFREQIVKNFKVIVNKEKSKFQDTIGDKKLIAKLAENIKKNENLALKDKQENQESIKDLNDVVKTFHIKFDKQKKDNINLKNEIDSVRQKNNELIRKIEQQDTEMKVQKQNLQNFIEMMENQNVEEQEQDQEQQQDQEQIDEQNQTDVRSSQKSVRRVSMNFQQLQKKNSQIVEQMVKNKEEEQIKNQQSQLGRHSEMQLQPRKQSEYIILKMKIGQTQIEVETLKEQMQKMQEMSQMDTQPTIQKTSLPSSNQTIPKKIRRAESLKLDLDNLSNPDVLKEQLFLIQKKIDSMSNNEQLEDIQLMIDDKVSQQQFMILQNQINNITKETSSKQNNTTQQQKQPSQIQQPQISEQHLQKINRVPEIEEIIKDIQLQINENHDLFKQYQKHTNENIDIVKNDKVDKEGYNYFDQEAQSLQNRKVEDQYKVIRDHLSRINQKATNDECTMALFEDRINKIMTQIVQIDVEIQNLQNDDTKEIYEQIEKTKEGLQDQIKQFTTQLDLKSNKNDMNECEEVLLQKLDKCIEALMKKMADKNDTKKALLFLEKRINDLYSMSFEKKPSPEDDPLGAKRPMFWSCLSCDIDVDKFKGKLGEYKNWAVFPPKETSPDRMGRFGVGYYNMMRSRKLGLNDSGNNLINVVNDQVNHNLNIKTVDMSDRDDSQNLKNTSQNFSIKSNSGRKL